MQSLLSDSAEYKLRANTPFLPPQVTLRDLHAAVPRRLFQKSTMKVLLYIGRDLFFVGLFYKIVVYGDAYLAAALADSLFPGIRYMLQGLLWTLYWFWQSVAFAGVWCLGHEAGHGNLSDKAYFNHIIGFFLHSVQLLLVPYYAWRSTHRTHHKATASLERDENYVPRTRSNCKLPPSTIARPIDYHEIFEDMPIYTLCRMVGMLLVGWQYYLFTNIMGSPKHKGQIYVNHFFPSSPLFKPRERYLIIASNLGLMIASLLLWVSFRHVALSSFLSVYFVPYMLANSWIVMLTYLHHSDPTVPHYREKEWSFLRGATATVDRPFLGWIGRFFLHNISHDHVAHHLFSSIPFYNLPEATERIKKALQADYNYDSTSSFRALYRTFTQCCFVEDEGDIVFYKDSDGRALRELCINPRN